MNDDNFFDDDLPQTSDNNNTERVLAAFKELMQATEELEQVSAVAEGLSSKINKIKSDTLPELLREMGTELWRDPETGITVELVTSVNSSLPKDRDKRNDILNALRPIGIEEILGEEYNVVFIPNDQRSPVLRRLLGIPEPQLDVLEDEGDANAAPRLTNAQVAAIEDFRAAFDLGNMPAEEKLGCHPSRLAAWLKKKIESGFGEQVREAGIWHGKAAKINKPKEKKGAKA